MSGQDERELIVASLQKLLADGTVFAIRKRMLRLQAASLALDIPEEVWTSDGEDEAWRSIAKAIGEAGGDIPLDLDFHVSRSSFSEALNPDTLKTPDAVLRQLAEDRWLVINDGLFLVQIFGALEDPTALELVEALVEAYVQPLETDRS